MNNNGHDINTAFPHVEIYVLNPDTLERVAIVDEYQSFQWYPEFNKVGSFQLNVEMEYFLILREDMIVQNSNDRKHAGLVEYIEKVTDETGHETLTVKGRMIDALIGRNIAYGEYIYEDIEPANIIADLITKNAITPADRRIKNLEIGNLVRAREGVITYSGKNQKLSEIINDIAAMSGIGYYTRIDGNRMIFDTYLGENRTQEANTSTSIEVIEIPNMIVNGLFADAAGWQTFGRTGTGTNYRQPPLEPIEIPPAGLSFSGGIATKTKNYNRYWSPGGTIDSWNLSPHMQQNITLNQNNIYYTSIEVENNTDAIVSFGIDRLMQVERTSWERFDMLFVPEHSGVHVFYAGQGDLPEATNQIVRFRNALMINLTQVFGVGQEPTLDFISNNIYYENGWKYKRQIITLVPNLLDPVVLSRDRDNLISDTYTKDTTNEVTHLYVQGQGAPIPDMPTPIVTVLVAADKAASRRRKEDSIDLSRELPRTRDNVVIPETSYRAMLTARGKSLIRQMIVSEQVEAELYLLNNIVFGKDYYLGDLVNFVITFMGDGRVLKRYSTNLRITSSAESWGINEYSISLTLGEGVPDIHDFVKLIVKGAK